MPVVRCQEALVPDCTMFVDHLCSLWRRIWHRLLHVPELECCREHIVNQWPVRQLVLSTWAPSTRDMQRNARQLRDGAFGMDQRNGIDVLFIPLPVFEIFHLLVLRWGVAGQWPTVWKHP